MYVTAASKIIADTLSMATREPVSESRKCSFIGLPSELCGEAAAGDDSFGRCAPLPGAELEGPIGIVVSVGGADPELPAPKLEEPGNELPEPGAPDIPG